MGRKHKGYINDTAWLTLALCCCSVYIRNFFLPVAAKETKMLVYFFIKTNHKMGKKKGIPSVTPAPTPPTPAPTPPTPAPTPPTPAPTQPTPGIYTLDNTLICISWLLLICAIVTLTYYGYWPILVQPPLLIAFMFLIPAALAPIINLDKAVVKFLLGIAATPLFLFGDTLRLFVALHQVLSPGQPSPELYNERITDIYNSRTTIKEIQTYVNDFNVTKKGKFMFVGGPNAAGKSTTIEKALEGRSCVLKLEIGLSTGKELDIETAMYEKLGITDKRSAFSFLHWVDQEFCRPVYGHPLALYINLKTNKESKAGLEYKDCGSFASSTYQFGRTYTYDDQVGPVIFEASVPQVCHFTTCMCLPAVQPQALSLSKK